MSHGCFVENQHKFQGPAHSSLCDIVGAKSVNEAGVHPKVVLLREIHECDIEILMKHHFISSNFEVSRLHFGPKANKPKVLWTEKKEKKKRQLFEAFMY